MCPRAGSDKLAIIPRYDEEPDRWLLLLLHSALMRADVTSGIVVYSFEDGPNARRGCRFWKCVFERSAMNAPANCEQFELTHWLVLTCTQEKHYKKSEKRVFVVVELSVSMNWSDGDACELISLMMGKALLQLKQQRFNWNRKICLKLCKNAQVTNVTKYCIGLFPNCRLQCNH